MTDRESNDNSDYANGESLNVFISEDEPLPGEVPADSIVIVSENENN